MKNYISNKYKIDEKEIQNLKFDHNHCNTYEQIYASSGGINKTLILKFITSLIFMGLHSISNYENYWKTYFINQNNLPKIITKNQFKFICFALYLPISNDYFKDNII